MNKRDQRLLEARKLREKNAKLQAEADAKAREEEH
jgi:hypothetical protein